MHETSKLEKCFFQPKSMLFFRLEIKCYEIKWLNVINGKIKSFKWRYFYQFSRLVSFFYYKFSKIEEWKKKLNKLLYSMTFAMKTQKDVSTLSNVLKRLLLQSDLPERELNSFSIWLSLSMMNNKLFWNFSISYLTLVRFLEVKNMKKLCFLY